MSRQTRAASARAYSEAQGRIPTQLDLALDLLARRGDHGVTGWELHLEFPGRFTYPSASAVLSKLCKAGLVEDTERQRLASTGYATVRVLRARGNGPITLRGRAKGKANEALIVELRTLVEHLRAELAAMNGEPHPCPWCGEEIEVVVKRLEAIARSQT